MRSSDIPVLIVGGGAAGTMLSLQLARNGVSARTVDRLAQPATTSKAITIHARMAEIFERIDRRIAQRCLARAIPNKGYVLHFVDDAGHRREVRPGIDFTGLESKYPYILIHSQSETEEVLRDYLREEFGREIQWGSHCTGVEHLNDAVLATVEHADGSVERIQCRYLVACDGMNSGIRRSLGLLQDESEYAGTRMQNLDAVLHDFPDAEDWVHYCAGTDHFIMVVKLPGGFFRLLLSDRGEAAMPGKSPEEAFMNLVDRHFDGVRVGRRIWHSKWESRVSLSRAYRDRNVFLAGDSAHVHSTTGGQGMNCCMQDAWNLGWKLGLVLRGLASPELLDSYEAERRPVAEQVIWAASSLHEIFMGHGKGIEQRAQRISDREFLDKVVGHCSGLSYTYAEVLARDDNEDLPGPAIGDRVTAFDFDADVGMFDPVSPSRYLLAGIVGRSRDSREVEAAVDRLSKRFPLVLDSRVSTGNDAWFGRCGSDSQLVLVRPDGYIGDRRRVTGADALGRRLASALGIPGTDA